MEEKKLRWWQKLLLAVASPIVFLLLVEGAVRLLGVNTDLARNKNFQIGVPVWLLADPNWVHNVNQRLGADEGVDAADVAWLAHFEEARYIQYRLKPNINIQAVNPFNDVHVRKNITFSITSNSQGFRTREFSPKNPGTLRIVTLGDSGTFGWGVDPQYTWQYLLERRLAEPFNAAEVFNLGISGHTSRHGLNVLKHFARGLEPDVVVIGYGANDGRYVRRPATAVLAADETFWGGVRWTLLRLRSIQLLRKWLYSIHDPLEATVKSDPPSAAPGAGVRAVESDQFGLNLRAMIAESRSWGAEAILLALCTTGEYLQAMEEVSRSENVPLIDGKKLFIAGYDDIVAGRTYVPEFDDIRSLYGAEELARNSWLVVTSDGCHPNRIGTDIIAGALAEAVERIASGLGHSLR